MLTVSFIKSNYKTAQPNWNLGTINSNHKQNILALGARSLIEVYTPIPKQHLVITVNNFLKIKSSVHLG